jgi:hypothetical protein
MYHEALTIITCSYGPDAQRCRRLCQSVDRYVTDNIEHWLIVPRRDGSLFSDLHGGRRRVCFTEDLVPGHFRQFPLTNKMWLGPKGWPVRGWIMQQVTKLSVNYAVDTELLLYADSDLEFIRPLDLELLVQQKRLRLHRIPNASSGNPHLLWHKRAAELLGEQPRYFGSDYVGQLITWRRSRLQGLQAHIEEVQGESWYLSVTRSLRFSEYILYGAYVEHVLGPQENGHFYCADDICHSCWDHKDVENLRKSGDFISHRAQAMLIQSNLGLNFEQEAALFNVASQRGHLGGQRAGVSQ